MNDTPKENPETISSSVGRLLEHKVIGGMEAFELTRAKNISNGEMIRHLTDLATDMKKWTDKKIDSLWSELKKFHCPLCKSPKSNGEYCSKECIMENI